MENYFFISILLSAIVLVFIKFGKNTNNANYSLSSIAIISWLIPYPYIAELIPSEVLKEPLLLSFSQLSSASRSTLEKTTYFDIDLWFKWFLLTLFCIGLLLLVIRIIKFISWSNQIKSDPSLTLLHELSSTHQLPIYSINTISNGLLLGLFKPVIIISTSIKEPKHMALIVAHEKQHLASHDNIRLIFLEIIECLFWWNPLVRQLINENRFFIEARCDENTSKEYGHKHYIDDLASLILLNHHDKAQQLACTALSNNKNNITRIKLLKEKRKMTLKKKLTYTFITLTAITTMSWNMLATATSIDVNQQIKAESKQLGALINFNALITNKTTENKESTYQNELSFWVDFDKKITLDLGDSISVNFMAQDKGESVVLEYELIESSPSNNNVISKPRLTVSYGQEGTIEIDNPQISKYAYLIKATPVKVKNPSLSD